MKNEEKKLSLDDFAVLSFVTTLDRDQQKNIHGGSEASGPTSMPIFC